MNYIFLLLFKVYGLHRSMISRTPFNLKKRIIIQGLFFCGGGGFLGRSKTFVFVSQKNTFYSLSSTPICKEKHVAKVAIKKYVIDKSRRREKNHT